MDLKCPQCHLNQVRKLSGLYKEQKGIGLRLPPPEEPRYESLWSWEAFQAALHRRVGLPMAFGLMFIICSAVGACSAFSSGGLVLGLLLVCLIILIVVGFIRSRVTEAAAQRTTVERERPRWENAYQRWDQLYYCEVCDKLFVPNGQSSAMNEAEVVQFMYKK